MDDLAPAVTGDQIDGCGLTESELAIDALADLHSSLWGDPTHADMSWPDRPSADGQAFCVPTVTMLSEGIMERYAHPPDPDVREAGDEESGCAARRRSGCTDMQRSGMSVALKKQLHFRRSQ